MGLFTDHVSNMNIKTGYNKLIISWEDPIDDNWKCTRLVRKLGETAPQHPCDGITVVSNETPNKYQLNGFVDGDVINEKNYTYRLFIYDKNYNYDINTFITKLTSDDELEHVNNIKTARQPDNIKLNWENPLCNDFAGVIILRSAIGYPYITIEDGNYNFYGDFITKDINNNLTVLNATEYTDSENIENKQDYYYGIFPCTIGTDGKPNFYNIDKENTVSAVANIKPPSKVSEFDVTSLEKAITITWKDPSDKDWKKTVLIRKLDSEPTSPYDGITIATVNVKTEAANSIVDSDISIHRKYYYKCFPYNTNDNCQLNCDCKEGKLLVGEPYESDDSYLTLTNLDIIYQKNNDNISITLNWINPDLSICMDHNLKNIMIRYSYDRFPKHTADGEEAGIVDIPTNQYIHSITNKLDTFDIYYTLFVCDSFGVYSKGFNKQIFINSKAPGSVQDFVLLHMGNKISLSWTDPEDEDWKGTIIIKKVDVTPPASINDGTIVIDSIIRNQYKNSSYFDNISDDNINKTIYYQIYSYDTNNQYNAAVTKEIEIIDIVESVNNFNLAPNFNGIAITYTDPIDINWRSTKILRKEGSYPLSPNDGTIIINTTQKNKYITKSYYDENLVPGIVYYYKVFTYDKYGNINDDIEKFQMLYRNIDFAKYDYSNFSSWENWYIDANVGKLLVQATKSIAELTLKDIIILPGCNGEITLTLEVSNDSNLLVYNNDVLIKTVTNGGQCSIALSSGSNSIKLSYKKMTQYGYCSINNIAIKDII